MKIEAKKAESETMQVVLSEEQIDAIAEKAAQKAVASLTDHVYKQVGKGVINKFVFVVGVLAVALYLWAQGHGYLGNK